MRKALLFFIGFGLILNAHSGVNLKNGNFYISYNDIVVPGGGKKLEITRTYNSRSVAQGWFGFGWGSPFETHLKVSADGSVVIHENGSGAKTRFTSKKQIDPKDASLKIVEAMKKKASLTDKAAKELVEKLNNNAELRHQYSLTFGVKIPVAAGTVMYSNERGMQTLQKIAKGWKREFSDGKVNLFDDEGNLTKVEDKSGFVINLVYEKSKLKSIKDSQGKQLFFDWYPDSKVKHIWSAGDKKTAYKYKGDDLIESTDVGGNVYKYEYDSNHNLTKIAYSDGTAMKVEYSAKAPYVSKVVERNGDVTEYKYEVNPKNPDLHYWTYVTRKGFDGKPIKNKYEYENKVKPDGAVYTHRIATEINGLKTETIYSECCGLPLKIARGKHVTNFEYNDKGLLLKKSSTKGEYVEISYDKKWDKIESVKNNDGWTKFKYNDKGNLQQAQNSQGQAVSLIYDRANKITKMIDQDLKSKKSRTLAFKYNALGKPVVIEMSNVGKINVEYDNYGEIKKVDSKDGQKMAFQVVQAFQNLLAIVKPAGVNLNM